MKPRTCERDCVGVISANKAPQTHQDPQHRRLAGVDIPDNRHANLVDLLDRRRYKPDQEHGIGRWQAGGGQD